MIFVASVILDSPASPRLDSGLDRTQTPGFLKRASQVPGHPSRGNCGLARGSAPGPRHRAEARRSSPLVVLSRSDGRSGSESVSSAKPDLGGGRFCEVDAIKGVGIGLVVLIHSLRTTWDPGITSAEIWLGYVTRFAVPGFFAASGYLYATNRPISRQVIGRRLLRVFVPYLVASAAAQIFFLVSSIPSPERPLWRVILLASSFGAYYFVLMLALFIALSPGLARMGRRAVGFLLIPLLLVQVLIETGIVPPVNFFWHLRNPFLWAAYFVLGWWVRLHREAIVSALCAQRARWV
ncbi:MAG TPA: acyltransferase, partial [Myxococcales bacterium]|nr:acyltransferase [Myxococcales bacterium]